MVTRRSWLAVLLPLAILPFGCRAHPVSLAMMLISDEVADADVRRHQSNLVGRESSAADAVFGPRMDTLVDAHREKKVLIVYPVKGDITGMARYAVETTNGRITAISKGKRNIDGVEDVIKEAGLRSKLQGRPPAECADVLGPAAAVFRSATDNTPVWVFNTGNFTNLRGARYCVLRFDANGLCNDVRLVGVSASTKSDPLKG